MRGPVGPATTPANPRGIAADEKKNPANTGTGGEDASGGAQITGGTTGGVNVAERNFPGAGGAGDAAGDGGQTLCPGGVNTIEPVDGFACAGAGLVASCGAHSGDSFGVNVCEGTDGSTIGCWRDASCGM